MNTSSTTRAHTQRLLPRSERARQRARERQHTRTTGEPTTTPGLAVVPTLRPHIGGGWQFTGEWSLTHTRSGLETVPVEGAGLGHARDLAAVLADTGIDWTQHRDEIAHDARDLLLDLHRRACFAVWHAQPLRLRPTSWNPLAPSWFLHDPHADPDDEPVELFATYEDAAYAVAADELDGVEVRQGTDQEWQLRCAWTDCQAGVIGEDDHLMREPDRGQLRAAATDDRWRPLDDHRWLCPNCSYLFTPTTPA